MQVDKSQYIRLVDIAILGPLMIYWGYTGNLNKLNRFLLFGFGVSTVVYNMRNFYLNFKLPKSTSVDSSQLVQNNNVSLGVRG